MVHCSTERTSGGFAERGVAKSACSSSFFFTALVSVHFSRAEIDELLLCKRDVYEAAGESPKEQCTERNLQQAVPLVS